jgi:type IV pilus assembly protein PilA
MIEAKWFYTRGGQQQEGPVSAESVRQMLMTGHILPWDLAWCEGMPQWQPLHAIPDFAAVAQMKATAGVPGGTLGYQGQATVPTSESYRNAVIAFVVSLVSLVCCGFVFGVVAIVLAVTSQNEMKRSGDLRGYGFATAALIIGIISAVLHSVILIVQFMR